MTSGAAKPKGNRVSLMLDSGAFSAWRMGKRIDLKNYIAFCQNNADSIFRPVNLDVIPASPGIRPTTAQVEESAAQGWKNFERMRKAGVNSIPVFHAGERFYWLDKMLDSGTDYIGLSVSAFRGSPHEWLDRMWGHICGRGGYPTIKVHGFMLTSYDVFTKYPWYSADSTSWVMSPSYGNLIMPCPRGDGTYDYRRSPNVIATADPPKALKAYEQKGEAALGIRDGMPVRDPSKARKDGAHYDNLGPAEQAEILAYLKHVGISLEEVRTQYTARCSLGALYYMGLLRQSPIRPFHFSERTPGLFPSAEQVEANWGSDKPPPWKHPRVFFGIPLANPHMKALTRIGAFDRLVSYFYFAGKTGHRANLERLARTGLYRSDQERVRL